MKRINDYFDELMNAYEKKDYAEGLRISREAARECPGDGVKTRFWQACMHGLMGNAAEALAALRAGLSEGAWWSPVPLRHSLIPKELFGARGCLQARPGSRRFFLGERDDSNERAQPVIDALKAGGAPVRVRIMKGVGRDFPECFAGLIASDLAKLRGDP